MLDGIRTEGGALVTAPTADRNQEKQAELQRVLADTKSKTFNDLRDRAAYVYVTGTYPTHLRSYFTSMLRLVTRYQRRPASLDERLGSMQVDDDIVEALQLDRHPMVNKVRHYIGQGYRLAVNRTTTARRPYSRVFLYKFNDQDRIADRVTVQRDGSVKDGWD